MARIICFDTEEVSEELTDFIQEYIKLIYKRGYITESEEKNFRVQFQETYDSLLSVGNLLEVKKQLPKYGEKLDFFMEKMSDLKKEITLHNNSYVEKESDLLERYLDRILWDIDPNISLDKEQRKVVLSDADASLVVAGAGAGKTTTIAAKVKYLVEKQNINPEDIIVISYTNKAVDELVDRINKKLGIPAKVTTFHKFGNEIIKNTTEEYPEVEPYPLKYFIDILKNQIFENRMLLKNLLLFFGYYMDVPEESINFETVFRYYAYKVSLDYESMRSTLNQYTKEVIDSLTKKVRTIRGEFLRSVQEVQIANYLYLHGLEYEYEKVYEFDIINSRKRYTPDFFIRQGTKEIYLEHFGIHENGSSYRYSEEELEKYKKSIMDKIKIHRDHHTKLIYTFAEYKDGKSLLEHLEALLLEEGFLLEERDKSEVYRQLTKVESDKYIIRFAIFMQDFIRRFKINAYGEEDFEFLRKKTDNVRSRLFLKIAKEVYKQYQARLIQNQKIDFEDMINQAEKALASYDSEENPLNYRYVIVDEYQDIARQRFQLTKKLADICHAKIIAVGDDWQSIFAFSGSNITLFTDFIHLMGHGEMLQITRTYRNSQELIDIAGSFIQKNKNQIIKHLESPKHLKDPIVIKAYDDSYDIMKHKVQALLEVLQQIQKEFGEKAEVLLIGRYGFDLNQLCKTGEFSQYSNNKAKVKCKCFSKMRLTYLTAHSSKGLGFDNVVILNGMEGKFGFPSQIENDPIMKLVTVNDMSVPFAEERRLFYVALTRTKNRTYILTPQNRPSRFVIELAQKYHLPVEMELRYHPVSDTNLTLQCPNCGYPLKKEYNRNYGLTLYMCTNDPEVCDFMANRSDCLGDIHRCNRCKTGSMIIKANHTDGRFFFGCTNFNTAGIQCKNSEKIEINI